MENIPGRSAFWGLGEARLKDEHARVRIYAGINCGDFAGEVAIRVSGYAGDDGHPNLGARCTLFRAFAAEA